MAGGGWAARGCHSGSGPGGRAQACTGQAGAVTVCPGDSAEVRLLLGGGEAGGGGGRGEGGLQQKKPEAWKGHTGRSARVGGAGREEAAGGSAAASQHSDHGVPTTPL